MGSYHIDFFRKKATEMNAKKDQGKERQQRRQIHQKSQAKEGRR